MIEVYRSNVNGSFSLCQDSAPAIAVPNFAYFHKKLKVYEIIVNNLKTTETPIKIFRMGAVLTRSSKHSLNNSVRPFNPDAPSAPTCCIYKIGVCCKGATHIHRVPMLADDIHAFKQLLLCYCGDPCTSVRWSFNVTGRTEYIDAALTMTSEVLDMIKLELGVRAEPPADKCDVYCALNCSDYASPAA